MTRIRSGSNIQGSSILNDEAASRDQFDRGMYAEALADLILTCETPFVLAIFGDWGSGKTTLMRLIAGHVDNAQCIWFNAWAHQQDEAPALALLQAIAERGGITDTAKKAIITISAALSSALLKATTTLTLADVDQLARRYDEERFAQRSARSRLRDHFGSVITAARGANDRLVVFIDDLDRCHPEAALTFLEGVKLFLDQKGCVFVVAADQRELEQAIATKFGTTHTSAARYMDKLVQLPFAIPPIHGAALHEFIRTHIDPELHECVELISTSLGGNPRAIKRFINLLLLNHRVAKRSGVVPYSAIVLCSVLLLQFRDPAVYNLVRENPYLLAQKEDLLEPGSELFRNIQSRLPPEIPNIESYVHLTSEIGAQTPDLSEFPSTHEQFVPSPELSAVVGSGPFTRAQLTQAVWRYISVKGLQDNVRKQIVNPDACLAKVTGEGPVPLFHLIKVVGAHLRPASVVQAR